MWVKGVAVRSTEMMYLIQLIQRQFQSVSIRSICNFMTLKGFQFISHLGEGSYGQVIKARRISDGDVYAIKQVKLNSNFKDVENALNEIRILASVKHESIICYKEAFYEPETQTLCIVMELADGGDLQGKIESLQKKAQKFPQAEVWKTAQQLLKGLKALQQYQIIHRDIKCANIFYSNGVAKLGDMNVSKITEAEMASTQTGTPYYASPEVWRNEVYSYKSDIWSLGCVLYEMCSFSPPFKAKSLEVLNKKVQGGVYARIPSVYSNRLATFIDMCLTVQVSKRADVDKLLRILNCDSPKALNSVGSAKKLVIDEIEIPQEMEDLNKVLPKPKYREENDLNILDKFLRSRSPEPIFRIKQIKSQQNLRSPRVERTILNEPVSLKCIPDISESPISNLIRKKEADIQTLRKKAPLGNNIEKPPVKEGGIRRQKLSLVNLHYGYSPRALKPCK